ncbi:MAG: riboflavin synthase [Elusimicrobiota bacterium]|jgi:riboflavin synthase|nr:riboflavin synthase [Elusimicrobiota bacterium]
MFTGLIEDIGIIEKIGEAQLAVATKLDDIKTGDSIAVNGVCLSAVKIGGNTLYFDYSPQTDKLTNLSLLKANAKVNIERVLKLNSRLGGHIVSGHIDGTAKILEIQKLNDFYKFTFELNDNFKKYMAPKCSVAINGISLTVAEINARTFEVFVIPQTFSQTTLAFAKVGESVNIETDILAKYMESLIYKNNKKDISIDLLAENGFL